MSIGLPGEYLACLNLLGDGFQRGFSGPLDLRYRGPCRGVSLSCPALGFTDV
jgi:hypothetical protein